MVSSWISPKARKGISSRIAGRGLFATEQISGGEIVAVKGGHIVTTTQLRRLPDPLPNSEIQIADGLHLVALSPEEYEPVMLFINHSCEPNVGFAGNVVLIAMREVTAGDELTTDYALFDDCDGQMTCQCDTASCRRVINGHDWRRSDLQRRYCGYFSWYLQRKINRGAKRSGIIGDGCATTSTQRDVMCRNGCEPGPSMSCVRRRLSADQIGALKK